MKAIIQDSFSLDHSRVEKGTEIEILDLKINYEYFTHIVLKCIIKEKIEHIDISFILEKRDGNNLSDNVENRVKKIEKLLIQDNHEKALESLKIFLTSKKFGI